MKSEPSVVALDLRGTRLPIGAPVDRPNHVHDRAGRGTAALQRTTGA
jgi:hypothetical protein